MATEEVKFQPKDYKSDQYVRWCPGCGDHAVLNCLHKAMAEVGVAPHNMAVISGIGCSSRLPYYMNTYGFHTIHGRGAAIATGVKTARPDLSVWLITGDGDCLAIGGNHFIHAVRRNVDLNIVLFNNKIYGLTKGQYSPTSDRGEKMLFGKDNEKGIVLEGLKLKAVTIGQDGYTLDDVLVHDAHEKDNTLHMMLAMMSGDMPVALGVIRDVDAPTYDEAVHQQIEEVQAKNPIRNLQDYLMSGEIWKVK